MSNHPEHEPGEGGSINESQAGGKPLHGLAALPLKSGTRPGNEFEKTFALK